MNIINRLPFAFFLLSVAALFAFKTSYGQMELSAPLYFNQLEIGTFVGDGNPLAPNNPQPLTQFSSVGITSGSAGPISTSAPLYPESSSMTLERAQIGNGFASSVPRYYLGDEIVPPSVESDYWRVAPIRPGEILTNPDGTPLVDQNGDLLPNVSNAPTIPLAALAAGEYEKFYYSLHAERVFASQAGTVEIFWISSAPIGSPGAWDIRKETFNVSGAASGELRTIFWTEKSFDGPRVNIPSGRIERVNPVYSSSFPPSVANEFVPVGYVEVEDPNAQPYEETRTLWFDQISGSGQLAAYNQEGRILVEYLGAEISPGRHQFLGADVVEVSRAPSTILETIELGRRVLPHDGDDSLIASPQLDLSSGGQNSFYGTRALASGELIYNAERENLNADRVVFYWLEDSDAAISILPDPEVPGLSILWPKYQNRYFFVWPSDLADYAHVTTDAAGSSVTTGIVFDASIQPEIIFQDDGAQTESRLDANTQRLVVDLSNSNDGYNRTLLKFSNGNDVWYQPVYSQIEGRTQNLTTTQQSFYTTTVVLPTTVGLSAGMTVTGGGISGSTTILRVVGPTTIILADTIPDITAALTFSTIRSSTSGSSFYTTVTVPSTADLVVGGYAIKVNSSGDSLFRGFVERILNSTQFVLGGDLIEDDPTPIADGVHDFEFQDNFADDLGSKVGTSSTISTSAVAVSRTIGLVSGMDVSGPGITGSAKVVSVLDETSLVIDQDIGSRTNDLTYSLTLDGTSTTVVDRIEYTVPGTENLTVGTIVSGPGLSGIATITSIVDIDHIVLSETLQADGTYELSYTIESDKAAPIERAVVVGDRIERPSERYSLAGAISGGEGYQESAYLNPYTVGAVAAEAGAIIPVNALPTDDVVTVRWFEKVDPPNPAFAAFYVPSKVGVYTVSYPGALGQWNASAPLIEARVNHTATLLLDGRVLVVGGESISSVGLSSAEIYSPETGVWSATAPLTVGSARHNAVRLLDGRVLVAGGDSPSALDRTEIFDPETESWSTVGPMNVRRSYSTLTLLENGKVLAVGGFDESFNELDSAEIFDPETGAWTLTGSLNQPSYGHSAVLLKDGRVLASSEIYDPFTGVWTPTAALSGFANSVLLADGRVLLVGESRAGFYDPQSGVWTLTDTPTLARQSADLTFLPSGQVLLTGGTTGQGSVAAYEELFDPITETWTPVSALGAARYGHTAILLDRGGVLVTGGTSGGNFTRLSSTEMIDATGRIVMASNRGSPGLTAAQAAGYIYQQNDASAIGFNPNEEHALKLDSRYFALRDDLNDTSASDYTSEPFVLVGYTDPSDGRPAMRPFRVEREDAFNTFDYAWTAGTKIQGPMPLPLMQIPVNADGLISNTEVAGVLDLAPDATDTAPDHYDGFTFEDRQGYKWVYRGPHATGNPTFGMQWYYPMQDAFFVPGLDLNSQPATGTSLPYLRPIANGAVVGDAVNGTSLTVNYTPEWPEAVPALRVAETLTLAKYGLPDVRSQASADVLYEQSIALDGSARNSVVLHDPTRNLSVDLSDTGLDKIPASIRTSVYQGKTYFQGLPPHLQERFYFDPLASATGSLILTGIFHDEIAGEDYLDLNVLSREDAEELHDLAENEEGAAEALWTSAIDALATRLETFIEDPSRKGTFIVSSDGSKTFDIGPFDLPAVPDEDTARDSYALTSTGLGDGYVTLVFGNGEAPDLTPQGDPPVMQIIKVIPELYNGDLKVRLSSNPLDEKVTLRHSGDFAAEPENFVFEWRYAPPTASGTQPATYTYTKDTYLGDPTDSTSSAWRAIQNPDLARPLVGAFPTTELSLGRQVVIRDSAYDATSGLPGVILRSVKGADFSSGVPAQITFSTELGGLDGFVLYVNGAVALVHGNGVAALDALIGENAYDLRLLRASGIADLPVEGEQLVVVAEINNILYFRIFDATGAIVIDTDASKLSGRSSAITDLASRLANLWATTNLLSTDKAAVVTEAAAIVDFDIDSDASSSLSATGLSKQFLVDEAFFLKGPNTIEVALYTSADINTISDVDLRLEGSTKTDAVTANGSAWQLATGTPIPTNRTVVGGSPTAPLGSPLLVMSDNFFTMRYQASEFLADGTTPNPAFSLTNGEWSDWTRPALVEGWIKRVLAAINPFNQRMTDLYNNAVNTDVSLLTQSGTRWEGDIALTLDAIDDFGLISIYETVLNRGKEISIDSGYDYGPANDALLLAAGYLHDLYTILGNEAYSDAANPTISIDDETTVTEVNTSRFSFEGQVGSVLEEELALLRGRDDFLSPQVTQAPFYNRLFWNYTRGIDSGEALYATNYNINEKVGSSTEDGSIDAADAQRMFPQGHGDAYGHYLTALKGYYQLLANPSFTWVPRIEALNILGNTVSVDYQDERKFAEAAANVARTAEQIVALTHRQQYRDDPADGWEHFREGKAEHANAETGNTRHWGLDEWTSRSAQGAYYNWAVGNAILPDIDAQSTGIQKIDRTTVLELQLLPVSGVELQTSLDNANAHLNPLGLSPGAIAFDIDPSLLRDGTSHYEQIYDRALASVLNAKGAFDQAAKMTRLLRNQENTIDNYNATLEDQERAFNYQLIDLYGSPYPGDTGPGKTYAQGYAGPDLFNWFIVDKASGTPGYEDFVYDDGHLEEVTDYGYQGYNYKNTGVLDINEFIVPTKLDPTVPEDQQSFQLREYTVYVNRESHVQFSDEYFGPDVDLGKRPLSGELQNALLEAQDTWLKLDGAIGDFYVAKAKLQNQLTVFQEMLKTQRAQLALMEDNIDVTTGLRAAILALDLAIAGIDESSIASEDFADGLAAAFPKAVGLAPDVTSGARGAVKSGSAAAIGARGFTKLALLGVNGGLDLTIDRLASDLDLAMLELDFKQEELQAAYEYINDWRDLANSQYGIAQIAIAHQQNLQDVVDLMARGERILLEREIFRKRAATLVQGYRTNDLTFRTFRNEALEQYRTLFDLASRYTYLATKSYDYETGLLGTTEGQAVISRIIASRSLGDLTDGQPQATVSTLGDAGLAGTMAQLQADWSVAEGRLGINNPDQNGTLFSIRKELFRILDDPNDTDDDAAWQQILEQRMVSDLMSDPDIAAACRNLQSADGSAVPGIVISFGTTIEQGKNFFGLPLAGGDHAFSPSNFATKIYSVGVVLDGYIGMDPYAELIPNTKQPDVTGTDSNNPNSLSATPYLYLIPVGVDKMLAPPLGDTGEERSWNVQDQALPLPYNLGANAFSDSQFFNANGTLTEQPWILRKHQAFRPVDDPVFFYSGLRDEFQSSRLVGRSVWNTQWKIVIPAYALLSDEQEGLSRFAATVDDIRLFLRTYSNSGN